MESMVKKGRRKVVAITMKTKDIKRLLDMMKNIIMNQNMGKKKDMIMVKSMDIRKGGDFLNCNNFVIYFCLVTVLINK